MLIPEERSVLLGDACNYFTFMFDDYSTTISEYEESLKRLSGELAGKFDTVYLSHGDGNGHKEICKERGIDPNAKKEPDLPETRFDVR